MFLTLAIVITIPLVFGAVHPIVLGCYVSLILVGLGGWLLFSSEHESFSPPSVWLVVPLIVISYIALQSIPIPLEWLEYISPSRAERVKMVNELAGTVQQFVTLSETGVTGLYRATFLIALILYYYTLRRLMERQHHFFSLLVTCLVVVGIFEALYGLLQFVKPSIGMLWLSIPGRAAHGTIIYKNQYASLLNMIWPLALASGALYFIKLPKEKIVLDALTTTKLQAPLLIFASAAMALAVLFSLSRGGILAMVVVGLLLIILLPFPRKGKLWFFLIFICLLGGYGALLGLDILVSRFGSLDKSGAHRIEIYLASLPLLFEHGLTGVGIGSYTLLSPVYLEGFPANRLYDRVHNEYLELMIELGIPVAALLFGWILSGMICLKVGLNRAMKKTGADPGKIIIATAALCGLVGFLIHGGVDFGWRLPVNLVYSVTLLAICGNCVFEDSLLRDVNK